jgi:hypothetical protein
MLLRVHESIGRCTRLNERRALALIAYYEILSIEGGAELCELAQARTRRSRRDQALRS